MKLPQLSLRELFLLVVIAAMGCGWWVERSRLIGVCREWERAYGESQRDFVEIIDELTNRNYAATLRVERERLQSHLDDAENAMLEIGHASQ